MKISTSRRYIPIAIKYPLILENTRMHSRIRAVEVFSSIREYTTRYTRMCWNGQFSIFENGQFSIFACIRAYTRICVIPRIYSYILKYHLRIFENMPEYTRICNGLVLAHARYMKNVARSFSLLQLTLV